MAIVAFEVRQQGRIEFVGLGSAGGTDLGESIAEDVLRGLVFGIQVASGTVTAPPAGIVQRVASGRLGADVSAG